ncbi:MAG TPA: hypothetical protein IGS37_14735 [Synechococcales cyanobacterium M55_K2018_004]|nr:hypothetical protein [Synechococcales cyanobacterium M55_K2018_004]
MSYFNWIWQHSRLKATAAQRAGLADRPWCWPDIAIYPTIIWRTIDKQSFTLDITTPS